MNEDEFTKLFKYVEKRFDELSTQIEGKASQDSIDRLINTTGLLNA